MSPGIDADTVIGDDQLNSNLEIHVSIAYCFVSIFRC